ncbi:hypothetical protein [Aeoliella mucimassa]|nr:hypothetical protein [Aeoliella mucimassa]
MTSVYRLLGAACLALAFSTGCGKSGGLDKVVVEGDVTYDGNPVQNGEIRFHPIEGTEGPVSGAPIVDGHYRAVAKGGVPVGKHSVQIEAYDTTGNGGSSEMVAGGRTGARVNYLPDKYHRTSELTVEITGDSSQTTEDFNLEK